MKKFICFLLCLLSFVSFGEVKTNNQQPIVMTINDVVLLAIRNNPTVISSQLDRVTQKFSLMMAHHEFIPQYKLSGSLDYSSNVSNGILVVGKYGTITPEMTLKTGYGTELDVQSTNQFGIGHGNYNPAVVVSVTQPLIKGFGKAIVERNLADALDDEYINKLSLKNTFMQIIETVVIDYLSWVQTVESLKVNRLALKTYEKTIQNDQAKIKAGQMARSDIIQDQTQLAIQKVTVGNSKYSVEQARAKLLIDLGLDQDSNITIPADIDLYAILEQLTGGRTLPTLNDAKRLAIENDVSYQAACITLEKSKRSLVYAKDQQKWQVDLKASHTFGGGSGIGTNAGLGSLTNGYNQSSAVGLSFSIPIDDWGAKQTLLNAKIALQKAGIALESSKQNLAMNISDSMHLVNNLKDQITNTDRALKLQENNVNVAILKRQAGLISAFEFSQQQQSLINQQQNMIYAIINYINALTHFDYQIGTIGDRFHVIVNEHVR